MKDLTQWRSAATSLAFRGAKVCYWREGCGPDLLLLHGFPTSAWDWHRIWAELTRQYTVLAPDMLGFGLSAKPQRHPYSIFEQADIVQAVARQEGVNEVYVLAHDYGDTVAQELLARQSEDSRPLKVRKVCLLNGGIFPEAQRPLAIQRWLAGPFGALVGRLISRPQFNRSMSRIFAADTQPEPELLDAFWQLIDENQGRRIIHRLIRYLHERARFRDRWVGALQDAGEVSAFVAGMADPVSGPAMAARFRDQVPRGLLIELADVGHYPQLEAPRRVLDAVSGWLRPDD